MSRPIIFFFRYSHKLLFNEIKVHGLQFKTNNDICNMDKQSYLFTEPKIPSDVELQNSVSINTKTILLLTFYV